MAKPRFQIIQEEAIRLLGENPGGMRFKRLVDLISAKYPDINYNTVFTEVSYLNKNKQILRPSRGLYQLASAAEAETSVDEKAIVETEAGIRVTEERFYRSFADFLKNDLDEASEAEPIGGSGLRAKWGTPDILGAYKAQASDLVKFPTELIAGEVKIDPFQPVVAFGQAVAYRLFAHKTYIAMPTTLTESDLTRLETLCALFGVGLVLFDLNPERPDYIIRVRAQRFMPDMFYVNEFAERLKEHDRNTFEKLFG